MPFFTVIVPTYNRSRMTAAAVLSVLGQTEKDFECMVVDDGSTDDTARVLGALPKDPRVKLVFMGRNRGQHACRNHAIRLSSAEFVTFLDSDDVYLPGRLAAFKAAAARRPATGFWFSNAFSHRCGRIVGRLFDPSMDVPQGRVPGYYAVGDRWLPYVTTNVSIRREAFQTFGLFREDLRILEDTELYARMFAGGLEVGAIPQALSVRTLHDTQITRAYEREFQEAVVALKASGASGATYRERHAALVLEVAGYLWKSLEPARARKLLLEQLGGSARSSALYWKTFAPVPVLAALKSARGAWLKARFSTVFSPPEFVEAGRILDELRERAAAPGR